MNRRARKLVPIAILSGCGTGTSSGSTSDASIGSDTASATAFTCPAPSCNLGSTQFKLTVNGDPTRFCSSLCTGWLSITTDAGKAVSYYGGGCGTPDCCSCQMGACPGFACIDQPLTAMGLQGTWAGQTNGTSTCGAASQACSFSACAPAGNYVAVMCAYANAAASAVGANRRDKAAGLDLKGNSLVPFMSCPPKLNQAMRRISNRGQCQSRSVSAMG